MLFNEEISLNFRIKKEIVKGFSENVCFFNLKLLRKNSIRTTRLVFFYFKYLCNTTICHIYCKLKLVKTVDIKLINPLYRTRDTMCFFIESHIPTDKELNYIKNK